MVTVTGQGDNPMDVIHLQSIHAKQVGVHVGRQIAAVVCFMIKYEHENGCNTIMHLMLLLTHSL